MFNNRGSDYMNQFTLAARNVLLCALVTLPLAACGGGSDGSAAAATSQDTSTALVQQNVGLIDRSQTDGSASVASVASNTTSPAPITAAATPTSTNASNTTATGSSGSTASVGTVAKTTPVTPVPVTTTDGVATLDWLPPTSNTDGSALTNLAGYTVYYGTSPDNLSKSVKVSNAGLSAYTVTGLGSGTWYFAVTSYSADGVESARTTTVSTKI
jgi:hypothetical protein